MPVLDFKNWPNNEQEFRKPFDRLMPFHRVHVPDNQWIKNQKIFQPNIISGDGYSSGARSTKDYDGKFGEDIGKDIAQFFEGFLPFLHLGTAITSALAAFFRGIG